MTDTKTIVVPDDPNEAIADAAVLAANEAQRAQGAAADAIAHAEHAAATVADQAADQIRSSEERLAAWQAGLLNKQEQLQNEAMRREQEIGARLTQTETALTSILSRLEPPPAIPPSPSPEAVADPAALPETEPPPPESQPEKRRAHRWI